MIYTISIVNSCSILGKVGISILPNSINLSLCIDKSGLNTFDANESEIFTRILLWYCFKARSISVHVDITLSMVIDNKKTLHTQSRPVLSSEIKSLDISGGKQEKFLF